MCGIGYKLKRENGQLIFLIIIVRYNLGIARIKSNFEIEILTLLPLPDKKKYNKIKKMTTAVVKRDKTSVPETIVKKACVCRQRTLLIRKGSIKYCLLLLWARRV